VIALDPLWIGPTALALALVLGVPALWSPRVAWVRLAFAAIAGAVSIRYLWWRLVETVLPGHGSFGPDLWLWAVFGVEAAVMLATLTFLLMTCRVADRSGEADEAGRRWAERPEDAYPAVDVFIPTFDEGPEVLEKTIIAATALDWPDYTVHVLDDQRREWVRELAESRGARWVTRPDNRHAKAGNVNHALGITSAPFVLVLDADFAPHRNMLRRMMGLFDDPRVGIVQTPQHFYNADPIQTNLLIGDAVPDDQRMFFDVIAEGRDAWDAMFCCGSCGILRRQALEDIGGGLPTDSITEDMLTTLAMRRKGWITRYLNEKLSQGLAPESAKAFFVQRQRWARGNVQLVFLRNGPFGPGLRWVERLFYAPFYWVLEFPARAFGFLVPIVFLWTGLSPLAGATTESLLAHQLPMLILLAGWMHWIAPGKHPPLIGQASATFMTFRIAPAALSALVKPFGEPFRVTPKGKAAAGDGLEAFTFRVTLALFVLTVGGMLFNLTSWQPRPNTAGFYPIAAAWSLVNAIILALVMAMCFEAPRRRSEERFPADEPARLMIDGAQVPARLRDISVGGARLELETPVAVGGGWGLAVLEDVGPVPAMVVRSVGTTAQVRFDPGPGVREALIAKIFSGRYNNAPPPHGVAFVMRVLSARLFGRTWRDGPMGQPQAVAAPARRPVSRGPAEAGEGRGVEAA